MTHYKPDDYSEYGAVFYTLPVYHQEDYPPEETVVWVNDEPVPNEEVDRMLGYDPSEQDDVISTFSDLLRKPTGDGGRKRAAGEKPNWKVDCGHEDAMYRHLKRWEDGEYVDRDSGAHPLVHAAWRALAIAFQETENGRQSEYIARRLTDLREERLEQRDHD